MSPKKRENGYLRRTFRMVSSGVIWLGLSSLYYGLWMWRYAHAIPMPFFERGNWVVLALYAVPLFFFTRIYGGYRLGDLRIFELIYSHGLSLAMINGISWLQISLLAYRLISPFPLLLLSMAQMILVTLWAVAGNKLFYDWFPPRSLLLVYGSDGLDPQLLHKLRQRPEKYNIREIIGVDEGLEAVLDASRRYPAVLLCDVQSPQRNDILKFCYEQSIRTYITPKLSDIIIRGSEAMQLFDTPLLLSKNHGLSLEQRFVKRALDIVLSGLGMLLLSPLFLLVAAAIKLEDQGPVFYLQKRLTSDGREFEVCKFRSMIVEAEKDGVARLAAQGDGRITRVGRIIRAARLDELPQLLNILRGDMSVVGPRPERPELSRQYAEQMPEFQYRLKIQAGLTGYAQVYGKYNTTPYDKLKLDLMYIQNYSLLLDFKIILMTIKILFMKDSTEGIAEQADDGTDQILP